MEYVIQYCNLVQHQPF